METAPGISKPRVVKGHRNMKRLTLKLYRILDSTNQQEVDSVAANTERGAILVFRRRNPLAHNHQHVVAVEYVFPNC